MKSNNRYCNRHTTETVRIAKQANVKGKLEKLTFEFTNIPKDGLYNEIPHTLTPYERRVLREWNDDEKQKKDQHREAAAKEIMAWKKSYFESISPETLVKKHGITSPVAQCIGFKRSATDLSSSPSTSNANPQKKVQSTIIAFKCIDDEPRRREKKEGTAKTGTLPDPVVLPQQLNDADMKRRTGFVSAASFTLHNN